MEDENRTAGIRNDLSGEYHAPVVQAGQVHGDVTLHHHHAGGDAPDALANPVIATVGLRPGSTLADLVVDDDPPRHVTPSGTLHIVTLEARTARAVVLQAARAVVLSRRLPRPACLRPRIGRPIEPRRFLTDLDADPPRLLAQGTDFPFSISATDVEQFWFEPVTTTHEIAWQLEVDWTCAGHRGTTVINDNGQPFEVYPVAALFSDDEEEGGDGLGDGHSALQSCGSLGRHHPACPARRLEAASAAPAPPTQGRPVHAVSTVLPVPGGRPSAPSGNSTEEIYRDALALGTALASADPDDPATWPDHRKFARQVRTLLTRPGFRSHESEPFRAQLIRMLRYLFVSQQYELGIRTARTVRRAWSAALGEDHPDTLAAANRLAGFLYGFAKDDQARALWEDMLPRCERSLGDDHALTLTVAGNLGAALSQLGAHEAARDLFEDVLHRSRRALGEDHADTLRTAENLASILRKLKDHQAARTLGEDTLRRSRKALGEDHPSTLFAAERLALTLRELGETDTARALEEDIHERRRRVLGEDHPDTLRARRALT
ncbi:tetratricopeptide repeat protein [Streptomyces albus subsp. chlorinus]|uniref:tetratricopeptide repeat protein n=1 Tax=Streptomyces albus TaxID=1888 RepID=UPI0031F62C85